GGLEFTRTVRGVTETHRLDAPLLASADARKLRQLTEHFDGIYGGIARLARKEVTEEIYGPASLFSKVIAFGNKGIYLQRYKGLGEMNAEQLWETTLDPNVRTLLQVQIRETDVADLTFSQLMGDLVEPRREFIQENALNVANLDV
ncbi:MAG: DNA gyrase subunit B, partial [Alphaproteobacteria bacterium]|nr:DNA gyrase subunit B [Alphaproteobacteria bacterium]